MSVAIKKIRCAIYTRKSNEEGLEQEFNTLDAQREACEAYIKSQKHEGWEAIPTAYDDGGYSGGNMDRPALKRLLRDIECGQVDIVVVYKVDRLSRALSDFARMVDVFDKQSVSFVSVTQSFNTTTSMGRLTLNVLLSFAQFEREVTGERIRDKFAASKKKGMWMGGPRPLGYDIIDRKLVINEAEAKIVRYIYAYYLNKPKEEPLYPILSELNARGYKNKSYTSKRGNVVVGKEFTMPKIYSILSSAIYNGKVKHKDNIYEGLQTPIIDDEQWAHVQSTISKREFIRNPNKSIERPKLVGKISDYHGNTLGPVYSYKQTARGRYKMRYYINRQILTKGQTPSEFKRIRAEMIDDVVTKELSIVIQGLITNISNSNNNELVSVTLKQLQNFASNPIAFLHKLVLYPKHMEARVWFDCANRDLSQESIEELQSLFLPYGGKVTSMGKQGVFVTLNIKAQYKRSGGQLFIITKHGKHVEASVDATYYYPDDKSFAFIAKAFFWNKQVQTETNLTIKDIADASADNFEYVKRALNQRYLSPKIIEAIASKESSAQVSVKRMIKCRHWDWKKQEQELLGHVLQVA